MGVVASFIKLKWASGFPLLSESAAAGKTGEAIAIGALVALCAYVVIYSRRARATE